jgi:hypothetical protein
MVSLENKLCFDTLNKKIGLIYSYINSLNIIINTHTQYITHAFCENDLNTLNSYEKICKFLKQFIETYKNDLIKIDKNNLSNFNSMKFHFEELEKYQKKDVYNIHCVEKSEKNKPSQKPQKPPLNRKPYTKTSFKNNSNHINHNQKLNKDYRNEIDKEVFERIHNDKITSKTQLINSIHTDHETKEEHFNFMKTILNNLSNKGFIEINRQQITITEDFFDWYDSHNFTKEVVG